jgi:hypothetical protein
MQKREATSLCIPAGAAAGLVADHRPGVAKYAQFPSLVGRRKKPNVNICSTAGGVLSSWTVYHPATGVGFTYMLV